jgi:hypothetical protein
VDVFQRTDSINVHGVTGCMFASEADTVVEHYTYNFLSPFREKHARKVMKVHQAALTRTVVRRTRPRSCWGPAFVLVGHR